MRQAADILSSAPAMQIRYLEAMQAMAKSANSKIIFMPGAQSSSATAGLNAAITDSKTLAGEQGDGSGSGKNTFQDFGGQDPSFQQVMNAHVIENI